VRRRALLTALLPGLLPRLLPGLLPALLPILAGCGFRPLYMRDSGPGGFSASDELASIYLTVMVNREGQLMRQALQRRFEGSGSGIAKKYDLVANVGVSQEGIGILRDNSTTRYRMNGQVTWYLRKLDVAHTLVTTGSARAQDGLNVIDQQYFALDIDQENTTRRVVEALADQVTQQLAIYFRRQAAGNAPAAPSGVVPTSEPPPRMDVPGAIPQIDLPGPGMPETLRPDSL
jgi:LPS-assembly lipoprotein